MRLIALALLAVLATGCATGNYDHEFTTPVEPGVYEIEVTAILGTREDTAAACARHIAPQPGVEARACYIAWLDLIYAPVPMTPNDREAMAELGHEVLHDIFGAWHGPSWVER